MKFLGAVLVYLLFALVLGWGILLTFKGNPWVLLLGTAGYIVLLGKIGCLPRKSAH